VLRPWLPLTVRQHPDGANQGAREQYPRNQEPGPVKAGPQRGLAGDQENEDRTYVEVPAGGRLSKSRSCYGRERPKSKRASARGKEQRRWSARLVPAPCEDQCDRQRNEERRPPSGSGETGDSRNRAPSGIRDVLRGVRYGIGG